MQPGVEGEVEEWIRRRFEGVVKKTTRWAKEDLSMVGFPLQIFTRSGNEAHFQGDLHSPTIYWGIDERIYKYHSILFQICLL